MTFCCNSMPHFIRDRHMLKCVFICASNMTAYCVFLFADGVGVRGGCMCHVLSDIVRLTSLLEPLFPQLQKYLGRHL